MAGFFDRLTGGESGADEDHLEPEDRTGEPRPPPEEATRTPRRLRDATQELLKYGLLEESRKPNLYRLVMTHMTEVKQILEPLDLVLALDEVRGLAFVVVRESDDAEQDDWSHPLVRRQRLNLEQSLLVAILRQHFVAYEQEAGTGADEVLVAIDDLIPQLQIYLGDLGSDAKERNRVITLLDQLKGHGLVSAPDAHERITVRPIVAHLANPENLQALLDWLREQTREQAEQDDEGAAGDVRE
jgi:hypothetical protein